MNHVNDIPGGKQINEKCIELFQGNMRMTNDLIVTQLHYFK